MKSLHHVARRLAVALAAAAVAAVAPAVAVAGMSWHTVTPTRAQRAAIVKAFGDPLRAERCLIVRLAASNHAYARVRARIKADCQRWAFNGANVIHRRTDNHWRVVFEASDYSCPVPRIPRQVQRDLGICR